MVIDRPYIKDILRMVNIADTVVIPALSFSSDGLSFVAGDPSLPMVLRSSDAIRFGNVSGTNDAEVDLGDATHRVKSIYSSGSMVMSGKVTKYSGITAVGYGVPAIYASGRATAQTAANASVATYTPTADGTFEVAMNVLITTATTHTFTCQCTYTDEGNTARTLTMPFVLVAGSAIVTSIANGNGAVPYMGFALKIRVKANTAITLLTQAAGTYTTVVYNVEGTIKQLA